jgi:predicted acylesterase/phospholipase RssA
MSVAPPYRRRGFLASLSAAAFAPLAVGASPAEDPIRQSPISVSHALILIGGGARGAYEAGLVAGLAERGGIADGEILAPYGMVCGTSVGAINAWFVATGQYAELRRAWHTLAAADIIRLKSKYITLDRPHRFIGERIRAALRLAVGMFKNETGIARSQPVLDWMTQHIDPSRPLLMPMIWAVTNLTTQAPEYFYRLPPSFDPTMSAELHRVLRFTLGDTAVIREAPNEIFLRTLLASAAIPVVFDPVHLTMADGTEGDYVDGGVASNASVAIARSVARNIHVVLVDPVSQRETYKDIIDIVMGSYDTMQRKILEGDMRSVYVESLSKRARNKLAPEAKAELQSGSTDLRTFFHDLPVVDLAYIRPREPLPADLSAFEDQAKLDATFATGEADSARGFTPYGWETFRL